MYQQRNKEKKIIMKTLTTAQIKEMKIYDTCKKIKTLKADITLMKEHNILNVEITEMELKICENTLTFLNTL